MKAASKPSSRETSLERYPDSSKQTSQPLRGQRKSVPCLPTQMISAVHCPSLNEIQKQRDSNRIVSVYLERQRSSSSGSILEGGISEPFQGTVERLLSSHANKQSRGRKKSRGSMFTVELWSDAYIKKFVKPEEYTISKEQNRKIIREATKSTETYRRDLDSYFRKRNPEFDREGELIKHFVDEQCFATPRQERPKIVFDFLKRDVIAIEDQTKDVDCRKNQSKCASIPTNALEKLVKLEEPDEPPSIEREVPGPFSSRPSLETRTPSTQITSSNLAALSRPQSVCAVSLSRIPQVGSEVFNDNPPGREPRRRFSATSLDEDLNLLQDPANLKYFENGQLNALNDTPPRTSRSIKSSHLSRCLELSKIKKSNSKVRSSNNINFLIKSIEFEQQHSSRKNSLKPKAMPDVMFIQPCLREKMLKNRAQAAANNLKIKSSVFDTFYQQRPSTSRKLWHP